MAQRLRFMRQRFSQISVRPRIPSSGVRAIPALALEDLYDVFHPESDRNPFFDPTLGGGAKAAVEPGVTAG